MKTRLFNRLFAMQGIAISMIVSILMMATLSSPALAQTAVTTNPSLAAASGVLANTPKPLLRNTFNHIKTGFQLKGAHLSVACETCHVGGTFKGTPKDCAGCHTVGRLVAATPKTQDHIPTTKPCDACHANGASFLTAIMDHTGLTEPCATCHGGSYSPMVKSVPHDTTHQQNSNIPCDNCHKNTFTFTGSRFDHTNTIGDCASCHNGIAAQGQNAATHINTSSATYPVSGTQPCENCHTPALTPGWPKPTSFLGAVYDHTTTGNTIGTHTCLTCHVSLPGVKIKITGHVSSSLQCDACHTSTDPGGFTSWVMDHSDNNNLSGCAGCHTGATVGSAIVKGKPSFHIPNTPVCENCHTNTSPNGFTSWTMNHTAISPTISCATCHSTGGDTTLGTAPAVTVKGEPASTSVHIKNAPVCENCHTSTTVPGGFASWTMGPTGHAAISPTLSCATCHDTGASVPATVVKIPTGSPGHVPYTGIDCGQCHKTTVTFKTWLASDVHTAAASILACSSCHSPTGVSFFDVSIVSYPANHSTFLPANLTIVTPTSDCSACHNTTSFLGATGGHDMTTTGIAAAKGNCASCHKSGGTGRAFTSQHIPSSLAGASIAKGGVGQCDNCHTDSYTSFSFLSETISHTPGTAYPATAKCSDCHSGTYSATEGVKSLPTGTPGTGGHITIPGTTDCSACHSTTTFTGWQASNVHTAVGATATSAASTAPCSSCHGSGLTFYNATVKTLPAQPASHINFNSGTDCVKCHNSLSTFTSWVMGSPGHTQANSLSCATCHDSTATVPASVVLKPTAATPGSNGATLHIPVNAGTTCDQCHGTGYASFTTWTMGSTGHASVNGISCASCHSPSGATFKDVSLVTYPSIHNTFSPTATSASDCSTCHNTTTFFGATNGHDMSATGIANAKNNCASCHYTGSPTNAKVFTASHIPSSTPGATIAKGGPGQCDNCHASSYTSFTFTGATISHTPGTAYLSGTACKTCHGGGLISGTTDYTGEGVKSLPPGTAGSGGHISLSTATTPVNDCSDCHSTSNFTGWQASNVHAAVGATASATSTRCDSCHGSGKAFFDATVKTLPAQPASHINFNAGIDCVTCHNSLSTFTSWNMGATGHTNVATAVPACSTCHDNGANVPAGVKLKPTQAGINTAGSSLHIYNAGATCDQCHGTSYVSFSTWTMGTTGHSYLGASTCSGCHTSGAAFFDVPLVTYPTGHDATATALTGFTFTTPTAPSSNCSTCHNTNTFKTTAGLHTTAAATAAGTCASGTCHNSTGTGRVFSTPPHIPSSAPGAKITGAIAGQCDKCHTGSYSSFSFAGAVMNHTSGYPSGTRCDACHGGTTYASEGVKNTTATTHIPFGTNDCSTCHTSNTTFTAWTASTVHTVVGAGTSPYTCASCHDNTHSYTSVVIKPAAATAHISYNATGVDCGSSSCHTSLTTFTTWTMGTTGHANVATAVPLCSTCHNTGATVPVSVVKKPTTGVGPTSHLAYTGDCGQCHKTTTTFTGWLTSDVHAAVTAATCASCHSPNGATFFDVSLVTFPASGHTYAPVGSDCSSCHTKTSFLGATNGHDMSTAGQAAAAKNCASSSCHSSPTGLGKVFTAAHIPSSTPGATITSGGIGQCDNCHTSSYSSLTFTGATISHTPGVAYPATTKCSTCHIGTYAATEGVKSLPTTGHIPYTLGTSLDCNACHKTTTSFTGWLASDVHTAVSAGTTPYTCATCHDSSKSYTSVVIKPAAATSHISYNTGVDCGSSSCHTSLTTFTTWTMGSTGHANVATAVPLCSTCHDTNATAPVSVVKKPTMAGLGANGASLHIYYAAGDCGQCHKTTTTFTGWLASNVHTAVGDTSAPSAGGQATACSSCHSPTGATFYNVVPALVSFPASHSYAASNSNCGSCHSMTSFLGATGGHDTSATGIANATHNCAQSGCHISGGAGKVFTTPPHIPSSPAGGTLASQAVGQCDYCHTGAYLGMSFLTETMNHTSGYPSGTACSTCHGGTTYASEGVKNSTATTHIPFTGDCSTCHTSTSTFTAWTSATVHTAVGAGTTVACATCHSGTPTAYTGVVNIPTSTHITLNPATLACQTCHTGTTYAPGTFNQWTMSTTQHTTNGNTASCIACHGSGKSFTNNGGTALVTLVTPPHVPVGTTDCATSGCHTATYTTGAFATSALTGGTLSATGHTAALAVTSQCGTCHGTGGTIYTGVKTIDSAHISSAFYPAEDCSVCHTAGNSNNYATGGFSYTVQLMKGNAPSHTGTGGTHPCYNCHNGTIATGTSSYAGHTTVTPPTDCGSCHTSATTLAFTSFAGASGGGHGAAGSAQALADAANCAAACHKSGGSGKVFTAQHIPSSAPGATIGKSAVGQCDYCHTASYASMSFSTYTSANIHLATAIGATACGTCHNGSYTAEGLTGAQAKTLSGINHIPTTINPGDCSVCHSGTTNWTTMTSSASLHNGNKGQGAGGVYCVTCHLTGTTYTVPSGFTRKSHNGASTSKDCSASGCHTKATTSFNSWST